MRALGLEPVGGVRTRLRNQMKRLFSAHVSLVYEDKRGMVIAGSQVADRAELWWNERKPDQPPLWESSLCATLFIWGMDWGAVTLRVWPTALRPARAENTTCVYHGAHPCGQE